MSNIPSMANKTLDRCLELVPGILWVGNHGETSALSCNPYLIMDGKEAVVVDGGSQPDFAAVMMKILQTGIQPSAISALIFQHYDPDLCGAVAHFEDIIDNDELKIISHSENERFIRSYAFRSQFLGLNEIQHRFYFRSGRSLRFYETPYAHTYGSFVTFDEKTGLLFSSDLCGGYGRRSELFLKVHPQCANCTPQSVCPFHRHTCPISEILEFHRLLMPSQRVLRYALEILSNIPFAILAPQHGYVVEHVKDAGIIFEHLVALDGVGVDRFLDKRPYAAIGDIDPLRQRIFSDGRE
jgi:flavorubredoxin